MELSSKATIFGANLGDIIGKQLPDLSSLGLLHKFDLEDTCLDLNSLKIGGSAQQLPVPATSVSGTLTATMPAPFSATAQKISTIAASTTWVDVGSPTAAAASYAGSATTLVINLPDDIPGIVVEGAATASNVRETFPGTATAILGAATGLVEIDISVNEG